MNSEANQLKLTRRQELVLLEQGEAILHGVVAAALERLVLDITPEVLVQSRWVSVVHLVDLVGVIDGGEMGGDDDNHVVFGSFVSKARVCRIQLVFNSRAMCAYAATHAGA